MVGKGSKIAFLFEGCYYLIVHAIKIIILTLLLFLTQRSYSGELSGKIQLYKNGKKLKDSKEVVIYLVGVNQKAPAKAKRLGQKNLKFTPAITVLTKGQTLEIINDDNVVHNIFSTSKSNPFDIGMSSPNSKRHVTFNKTGVVKTYCNIHPNMFSNILVLPNKLYAISKANGSYRIRNIPKGDYRVFAWHTLAKIQKANFTMKTNQRIKKNWKIKLAKRSTKHLNKHGKQYSKSGYSL